MYMSVRSSILYNRKNRVYPIPPSSPPIHHLLSHRLLGIYVNINIHRFVINITSIILRLSSPRGRNNTIALDATRFCNADYREKDRTKRVKRCRAHNSERDADRPWFRVSRPPSLRLCLCRVSDRHRLFPENIENRKHPQNTEINITGTYLASIYRIQA